MAQEKSTLVSSLARQITMRMHWIHRHVDIMQTEKTPTDMYIVNRQSKHKHSHTCALPFILPYVSVVCRAWPVVNGINFMLAEWITRSCEPSGNPCWRRSHTGSALTHHCTKYFSLHSDYSCSGCLCVCACLRGPALLEISVWFHSALSFSPSLSLSLPLPPSPLSGSPVSLFLFFSLCPCALPLHREQDRSVWRHGNAGYSCDQLAGRGRWKASPQERGVLLCLCACVCAH